MVVLAVILTAAVECGWFHNSHWQWFEITGQNSLVWNLGPLLIDANSHTVHDLFGGFEQLELEACSSIDSHIYQYLFHWIF